MPPHRRSFAYLSLIVLVVVLPTAIALAWYQVSRDPNLRPLGITEQALRAYNGQGEGLEIVAVVDWVPPHTGNFTRAQLQTALDQSFRAKGVEVRVEFRDGRGETQITYLVGRTMLGPFPTARSSEGVSAAVEAYKMH